MVYALPEDPAAVTSRTVEGPPEPVVSFGAYGFGDGQFVYPTDVALLLSGDPARPVTRIYVSEYGGNDRISIWEPDADDPLLIRYVRSFGEHGSGPGVIFHRPQSITVDAARQELIVADSGNHRIGRFTLEGERIAWIGGMETAGGEEGFHYPYGVTLLDDGTFLICEYGGCRLRRVDLHAAEPEGVWLGRYGVAGRLAGELFNPWGAAVIGKTGYVLDSGNSRVQAFRLPVGASSSGVRVTQGAAP
jgi:hypothetical protein